MRIPPIVVMVAVLVACSETSATTSTSEPGAVTSSTTTAGTTTTSTAPSPAGTADLIIHNARVVTMGPDRNVAGALAVTDGDITAVGDDDVVLAHAGPGTLVVDVGGRTVIPGFVDPHTHLHQGELLAGGTTTAGVLSVDPEGVAAFRTLDDAGELTVRTRLYVLYNSVCGDRPFGEFYLESPFTQDPELKLTVAGVKVFADGGVCQGPAVSFTYPDTVPQELQDAGWVGNGDLYITSEELAEVVAEVDGQGGQVAVHAIGDEALRTTLTGMAAAKQIGLDLRHRIEHNALVGLLTPEELALYGEADVTPIVQMSPWAHACEEGRSEMWTSIWPDEVINSVENRTLISAVNPGITMAWHGDGPYINGTPLQQMFSAVAGGSVDSETGEPCYPELWHWFPTVDVEEALALTTINAARAMLIEHRVGSLEVGKVADLLVLAEDPFHPDPELGLAANYPLVTMIDGAVHHCEGEMCEQFGSAAEPPPATDAGGDTPVVHAIVAGVRASQEHSPAEGAVDGDLDSGWVSGDHAPQWIELDLGEVRNLDRLQLHVDQAPPGPTIHEIYAGPDPDPQERVALVEEDTDWGDELTVNIGGPARYIRIVTTESPSWVSWLEVEVILGP